MRKSIGAFLIAIAWIGGAHAQGYPARPVSIVVGFTAGGSTDIITRLVAEDLRKSGGQSVIVENRPGAGGNIGAAYVAKASPDGYTLLMSSPARYSARQKPVTCSRGYGRSIGRRISVSRALRDDAGGARAGCAA